MQLFSITAKPGFQKAESAEVQNVRILALIEVLFWKPYPAHLAPAHNIMQWFDGKRMNGTIKHHSCITSTASTVTNEAVNAKRTPVALHPCRRFNRQTDGPNK